MAGRGQARGGRATDTTTPPPLTLQQVAAMLERATRAVRTAGHPMTLEAVRAMSDSELRRDPVLSVAFDRGWRACAAAVNRTTTRRPDHESKPKKRKPNTASTSAPTPATTTTPKPPQPSPKPPKTTGAVRIPPPPSDWSEAERKRVLGFNPTTNPHPANTLRGGHRSTVRGNTSGSPGNRPTGASRHIREASQEGVKETARDRNHKRFLEMLDRKKARKAKASSQQHRLAKHPATDDQPTSAPENLPSSPVAMEVDQPEPGTAATLPSTGSTNLVSPSKDEDDIYLDEPGLSLPFDDELEVPPSFRDD